MAALRKLVAKLDRPVIVVYAFQFELDALETVFPEGRKVDQEAINDWNAGKLKIMFAHPASAGHGLNLQFGGHTIIWYGTTWSLENYMQTNARVTRRGQKNGYTDIYHIITDNSMEEVVVSRLRAKRQTQDRFMTAIAEGVMAQGEI